MKAVANQKCDLPISQNVGERIPVPCVTSQSPVTLKEIEKELSLQHFNQREELFKDADLIHWETTQALLS